MAGGRITGPRTRDDPPVLDDWGMVTRPIITGPVPVIIIGPVVVVISQPSVSVVTTVAVAAVATTLLAANAARLGAMIYNDANTRLFVKLGAGASTANFTVRLDGQGYFELPFPVYTGIITAVRAAGPAASVQVTELT